MSANFMTIALTSVTSAAIGGLIVAGTVNLQDTTPGTAQTGHTNITGYALAGRFGSGVSPTLAKVQVKETGPLQGVRSETNSGVAVFGKSTATTGLGAGGYFTTSSVGGRGVVAESLSTTGASVGGLFYNYSTTGGTGVWGKHTGTSGNAVGVLGETASPNGKGGYFANSSSGTNVSLAGDTTNAVVAKGDIKRSYGANYFSAVPVAYGWVRATGDIEAGTGNFTVTKVGTGIYDIAINGVSWDIFDGDVSVAVALSPHNYFCASEGGAANTCEIRTRLHDGTAVDGQFHFVAYSKTNSAARPLLPDTRGLTQSAWAEKYPAEAARHKAKLQAWRKGLEQNPGPR